MSEKFKKIKPPAVDLRGASRDGLNDIIKFFEKRLELDMKQFSAFEKNQITKESEVYAYYHNRVQLLRDGIAKAKELRKQYRTIQL